LEPPDGENPGVRIIGGEFGGRRLRAPKGRRTRPTPDRVREALFSVLGDRVAGAHVVELFAGTGSLGLEALSRGARHAVFLERDAAALRCLEENVAALGVAGRATVQRRSAYAFARSANAAEPFDLVFCDPPFRSFEEAAGRRRMEDLLGSLPLAPGGLVVVEHRAGALGDFSPPALRPAGVRKWGSTGMALYESVR